MNPQMDIVTIFNNVISEIDNDSSRIQFLTFTAIQSIARAQEIVDIINTSLLRFVHSPEQQVYVLYVIDSIVKNDSTRTYLQLICPGLDEKVVDVYHGCHQQLRQYIIDLINTWNGSFPNEIIQSIIRQINPPEPIIQPPPQQYYQQIPPQQLQQPPAQYQQYLNQQPMKREPEGFNQAAMPPQKRMVSLYENPELPSIGIDEEIATNPYIQSVVEQRPEPPIESTPNVNEVDAIDLMKSSNNQEPKEVQLEPISEPIQQTTTITRKYNLDPQCDICGVHCHNIDQHKQWHQRCDSLKDGISRDWYVSSNTWITEPISEHATIQAFAADKEEEAKAPQKVEEIPEQSQVVLYPIDEHSMNCDICKEKFEISDDGLHFKNVIAGKNGKLVHKECAEHV
ncbi:hypothetical protein ENUP19_0296G0007 [Entamoeba nuttalli]|uniref:CID domain-containing protein n=1 Tax=Entamoeba nuttalli TaxID=412467 RepID=A0ABQ0DUF0_9EUKA